MNGIDWLKLIVSLVACQSAGLLGGIFTAKSIKTWYVTLNKPSFNPPGWIFGPVWTALYLMMGVSLYIIWKKAVETDVRLAIAVFIVQLALNALWSYLFFGIHNPRIAFFEVLFLWLFILICIIIFFPVSHTASYLLIPYLLWVSFASFLNYTIWKLNP